MTANQINTILSRAKKPSELVIITGSLKTTISEFSDYKVVRHENLLILSIEKDQKLYIDTAQITMINIKIDKNQ